MKNVIVFMVFGVIFTTSKNLAQNKNKWEVGLSSAIIKFNNKNASFIGDKHIFHIPRLNLTYNFKNNFSFDAEVGFNTINNIGLIKNTVKYNSFGGSVRYHFKKQLGILEPYTFIGGTFVKSERKRTPTLNFGIGNTFWLSNRVGLNTQVIYKFSEKRFESMRSHLQFTFGVIYSPNFNISLFRRKRIWQVKH